MNREDDAYDTNEEMDEANTSPIEPQEKLDVDPEVLKDQPSYDNVVEAKQWSGLKTKYHMGLVGASNSGKTSFFKQLLADQKIPTAQVYIIVADPPGKSELVTGFATNAYLNGQEFKEPQYLHYTPTEIKQAIAYCLEPAYQTISKVIFLNDCLISNSKTRDDIAFFINKAKNFSTTVIVEIHNLVGPNMALLRNALEVRIYLGLKARQLALELELPVNDSLIDRYSTKTDRYEQTIIWDKEHGLFNRQYLPY